MNDQNETREHRQQRLSIEREFGIGIGGSAAWTMSVDQMRDLAERLASRHHRRRGIRALVQKVGYERACQITGSRLRS